MVIFFFVLSCVFFKKKKNSNLQGKNKRVEVNSFFPTISYLFLLLQSDILSFSVFFPPMFYMKF